MNNKFQYSMIISWSDEDQTFIVRIPEFDDALTHGNTYEEAVRMGYDLIETLVDLYTEDGTPLPLPNKFAA